MFNSIPSGFERVIDLSNNHKDKDNHKQLSIKSSTSTSKPTLTFSTSKSSSSSLSTTTSNNKNNNSKTVTQFPDFESSEYGKKVSNTITNITTNGTTTTTPPRQSTNNILSTSKSRASSLFSSSSPSLSISPPPWIKKSSSSSFSSSSSSSPSLIKSTTTTSTTNNNSSKSRIIPTTSVPNIKKGNNITTTTTKPSSLSSSSSILKSFSLTTNAHPLKIATFGSSKSNANKKSSSSTPTSNNGRRRLNIGRNDSDNDEGESVGDSDTSEGDESNDDDESDDSIVVSDDEEEEISDFSNDEEDDENGSDPDENITYESTSEEDSEEIIYDDSESDEEEYDDLEDDELHHKIQEIKKARSNVKIMHRSYDRSEFEQTLAEENQHRKMVTPIEFFVNGTRNITNILRWMFNTCAFGNSIPSLVDESIHTETDVEAFITACQEELCGYPLIKKSKSSILSPTRRSSSSSSSSSNINNNENENEEDFNISPSHTVKAYRLWLRIRELARIAILYAEDIPLDDTFKHFLNVLTSPECNDEFFVNTYNPSSPLLATRSKKPKCIFSNTPTANTRIRLYHVTDNSRVLAEFYFNSEHPTTKKSSISIFPTYGAFIFAFLRLWFLNRIIHYKFVQDIVPIWNQELHLVDEKCRACRAHNPKEIRALLIKHYRSTIQTKISKQIFKFSEEITDLLISLSLISSKNNEIE